MAAATYLYCVIKAAPKPPLTGVPPGLAGGTPPQLLQGPPGLWLVSSQVPLDVYGPGKLEPALKDMDWVGRTAMAHEAVVEFFATRSGTTVVPMKLFTMFSTPDRALADIAERRRTIESAMRRIAGAEEWGIRVLRAQGVGRTSGGPPSVPQSGAAYLAGKKQKRDDAQQARIAAAEAAITAFDRLSSLAKASKRRDDVPPAGATPPLLDAAFLVPSSRRDRFRSAARREAEACARAGAQLTLTGPWPAYNFIQVDERP